MFIFFHNWNKVPRTMFGARKVAGSASVNKVKQSEIGFSLRVGLSVYSAT